MAAAAILFLIDSSQKLFRSSEIPREQTYQIWMQSNTCIVGNLLDKSFILWETRICELSTSGIIDGGF